MSLKQLFEVDEFECGFLKFNDFECEFSKTNEFECGFLKPINLNVLLVIKHSMNVDFFKFKLTLQK